MAPNNKEKKPKTYKDSYRDKGWYGKVPDPHKVGKKNKGDNIDPEGNKEAPREKDLIDYAIETKDYALATSLLGKNGKIPDPIKDKIEKLQEVNFKSVEEIAQEVTHKIMKKAIEEGEI